MHRVDACVFDSYTSIWVLPALSLLPEVVLQQADAGKHQPLQDAGTASALIGAASWRRSRPGMEHHDWRGCSGLQEMQDGQQGALFALGSPLGGQSHFQQQHSGFSGMQQGAGSGVGAPVLCWRRVVVWGEFDSVLFALIWLRSHPQPPAWCRGCPWLFLGHRAGCHGASEPLGPA